MSPLPINPNERFVSNTSRARRGLDELKNLEGSFARHLGKIEGAMGPRIVRSICTCEPNLFKLKCGGTREFGAIMFKSSYRLETDDTMVGVMGEDGKTFVNSGIGNGLPLAGVQWHQLRRKTREELVNAIRSIFIDVSLIQSVDILEMKCEGAELIDLPIKKRNNILHLQHTILLENAMYEDQATLLDLLKRDAEPEEATVETPPTWMLKPGLSLDALANAVKFIAFDEITLYFQLSGWQSRTGKEDPDRFEKFFSRRTHSETTNHRKLRLERLKRTLGQPTAV